jgi:hypothetical protein
MRGMDAANDMVFDELKRAGHKKLTKLPQVRFKALKSLGIALPAVAGTYFGTKAILNTLD